MFGLAENAILLNYGGKLGQRPIFNNVQLNMAWRAFMPQHDAPFPVREQAGHTTKFSLENNIYIDTRDRSMLASRGAFFKVSQEYAGLLGDSAFLKHQLDLQVIFISVILSNFFTASCSVNIWRNIKWIFSMCYC